MDAIKVENLTKKFNGFKAVNDISFSVEEGKLFALLGPNGAGKSTTIKILTTLLKQSGGQAFVNGYDTLKDKNQVRNSFGIVFQDTSLDTELTAYENMDFHASLYNTPKEVKKERIKSLLEFVGLWERKDSIVKTFSGGMKRRLEIARGLIHHPKILFLDEPTLGLDAQTRNYLWKYLKELNKKEKMTIFFTTHYIDEAERIADRVAIIDRGRIIINESPQKIKRETETNSLEEAFLKLTGKTVRERESSALDNLRLHKKMRGR